MSVRLTDKLVDNLPPPATGNQIFWDAPDSKGKGHIPGFGLRVTAAGARAFILNYRTRAGRDRRITIGSVGPWSLSAARTEAAALKRRVDQGEDPMEERRELRGAPTMAELCERFLTEHTSRKSPETQRAYRTATAEIRAALGSRKVAELSYDDIERLHRRVSDRTKYQANRIAAVLSRMFNMAIRSGWRTDNPVRGLPRNEEPKRRRYLSKDEIGRLLSALDAHPDQQAANIIRILLLTGARKSEVLKMRWQDIDPEAGRWVKPSAHTKTKIEHQVTLSSAAVEILEELRDNGSPYVFPEKNGHRADFFRMWVAVCRAAGIKNARVHDLRHTNAALMASDGASLLVIGAALGHTQASTTHRYSHLFDDPLRAATEKVGASFKALSKGGKVVAMRERK
jgi:integrase